jgi:hypothetical protein
MGFHRIFWDFKGISEDLMGFHRAEVKYPEKMDV